MGKQVCSAFMILVCIFMVVPRAKGFIIESPKEGDTLVLGEPVKWRIRLEPGEKCERIDLRPAKFDPLTGVYEWTENLTLTSGGSNVPGKINLGFLGEPVHSCDDGDVVSVNVVLPPTTVLRSIGASINGRKESFLVLYKHDNGNLVKTSSSFGEVYVRGGYSDGVARDIVAHPDTTYTSSDEKVVKITPPGKWVLNDKFPDLPRDAEDERPWNAALVTAVGPGTAKIIVRNGSLETSVTAIVNVKSCSEWKKSPLSQPKFSLPVCD